MRLRSISTAILALAVLGGCGAAKPPSEKTSKGRASAPDEDEPEPDPPPKKKKKKKRKQWYAKSVLTPVKGSKLKSTTVSFSQRENDETSVESDAPNGPRPGSYWLVVHEGDTCGANATKAGAPWAGARGAKLRFVIAKDLSGELESNVVEFDLAGDDGAIGRALVLHDDKKGKPGKAIACGVIEEVDEP